LSLSDIGPLASGRFAIVLWHMILDHEDKAEWLRP
jgi:hypothetical protein